MSPIYEIIQCDHGLSAKINMHRISQLELHWHQELELLLVLEGAAELCLRGKTHSLRESDLYLINSGEIHAISGDKNNIIVAIQIDPDFCAQSYSALSSSVFVWPDVQDKLQYTEFFCLVRDKITIIVDEYRKAKPGYALMIESLLYQLVLLFVRNLEVRERSSSADEKQNRLEKERMKRITAYIHEHYTDRITLDELACQEHLNSNYLSRIFKHQLGVSYQEFINSLRLSKATKLLIDSQRRIHDIALDVGFANVKSFNKAFKDMHGVTPSEFRHIKSPTELLKESASYMDFDTITAMAKLAAYRLQESNGTAPQWDRETRQNIHISVDACAKNTRPFKEWKKLMGMGRACDGLRWDVQQQILLAAKELGIKHLRFHGLFSDEMRVVYRDKQGSLHYNWQYIDCFFDFLHDAGIQPMPDLTFMPSCLKSSDDTVFWYQGNISAPAVLEEWTELVRKFVSHCIHRYGTAWVRECYFEIWNEPDYTWVDTETCDYFTFLKATIQALKEIDNGIQVAGPSIMHPIESNGWMDDFVDFVNAHNIQLSAITFHIYGERSYHKDSSGLIPVLGEKDTPNQCIVQYLDKIKRLNNPVETIFITEFNLSLLHQNYLLDTMFAACYYLHTVLQNRHLIDGIAFWTLSDIFEEDVRNIELFGGGFGLLTAQSIPKPTWHAHWFLNRLGSEILYQDDHGIITQENGSIQLLFYNLLFYDTVFKKGDHSLLTYENRSDVFEHGYSRVLRIQLLGLSGTYTVKQYALDQNNGSAFDIFRNMGSPKKPSREDTEYLRHVSRPTMNIQTLNTEKNDTIQTEIPPHGIRFIQIEPIG